MALGNNLKGIKKDSLIPAKKVKASSKPKKVAKTVAKKSIAKPKVKTKVESPPKAKIASKPKTATKKSAPAKSIVKAPQAGKPKEVANLDERVLLGGQNDSPITIKIIPSRRKTVRKTKLIFEGSLSLLEAEEIKKSLNTTFTDFDIIDIQLINITHLDIIPVQLLKIFINSYPDKKIKIDSDVPFDIKIILERAGFGSFMFKEEAA